MLELVEAGRLDPDLERALLEPADELAQAPRHADERLELRVGERDEVPGLEPPLRLLQHHLEPVLLEQLDRVELGVERARDRVGLRERLADEREARRQADPVRERDPLQVGERLAGADPGERTPVVARELPPQLVLEARLVGLERRQREAEDQVGDVVGAVLRERQQEQAERPPRVVVEPAEQAEVEQARAGRRA